MKRKLELAVICMFAAMAGIFAYDVVIGLHADRRFTLYSILRQISFGMPQQQIEALIARHEAPFFHKHISDGSYTLRVELGYGHSCQLLLSFGDKKLIGARIRSENGPESRFSDAPPDI